MPSRSSYNPYGIDQEYLRRRVSWAALQAGEQKYRNIQVLMNKQTMIVSSRRCGVVVDVSSVMEAYAKKFLNVNYACLSSGLENSKLYLTFSLQRSGQHVVLRWICENLDDVIHFNHCRFVRRGLNYILCPVTGRRIIYSSGKVDDSGLQGAEKLEASLPGKRFSNLLYSLEDVDIKDPLVGKILRRSDVTCILILRDPYNWLASNMKMRRSTLNHLEEKKEVLKRYLKQALGYAKYIQSHIVFINYNQFIQDLSYREHICDELGLEMLSRAEESLHDVPDFGGGSSFSGRRRITQLKQTVFTRWKEYIDNDDYRMILSDAELRTLSAEYFGDFPSFRELKQALAN